MTLATIRLRRVAITTEVRRHHGKTCIYKTRRDPMPCHVRLRIAVQQKNRRTGSGTDTVDDLTSARLDIFCPEAGHVIFGHSKSPSTSHGPDKGFQAIGCPEGVWHTVGSRTAATAIQRPILVNGYLPGEGLKAWRTHEPSN